MIAHLSEHVPLDGAISFFFCRFDDQRSLNASTILGSIAKQLLSDVPAVSFCQFNSELVGGIDIIHFLERTLDDKRQYFIVLDGLDECGEEEVKEVIDSLDALLEYPGLRVKIFWSSHPNERVWPAKRPADQLRIGLDSSAYRDKVASDIRRFIRVTLEEWLDGDAPLLQINDPALVLTIVDHLEREAEGM